MTKSRGDAEVRRRVVSILRDLVAAAGARWGVLLLADGRGFRPGAAVGLPPGVSPAARLGLPPGADLALHLIRPPVQGEEAPLLVPLRDGRRRLGLAALVGSGGDGPSPRRASPRLRALEGFARDRLSLGGLQRRYLSTVVVLLRTMEGKDFFARGHSDRVAEYSRKAGQAIGLDRTNLRHLSWAALLHDIGKVGIVDAILQKKDRLTDEEMAIVREHPVIGQRILQDLDQLRRAAVFVRGHHERWDGTGYPDGLRGREIPLPARILALAECFDTITSHTPYKLGRSVELAAQELRQEKGRMFDPDLVDPFLEAVIL